MNSMYGTTNQPPPNFHHHTTLDSTRRLSYSVREVTDSSEDDDPEVLNEDQRQQLSLEFSQDDVDMDQIAREIPLEDFDTVEDTSLPGRDAHALSRQSTRAKPPQSEDKSTIGQQRTMSQFYPYEAVPIATPNPIGSYSKIWLHRGRQFMDKDTWTCNLAQLKRRYYVCISKRDPRHNQKAIVRQVHMHLQDTILDPENVQRLVDHCRRNTENTHPELIKYVSTGKLLDRGRLDLAVLADRFLAESTGGTIQSDLLYEEGVKGDKITSGGMIAFKFQPAPSTTRHHNQQQQQQQLYQTLEVFAGCQGLGKGFALEGMNTTHAVEMDRSACDTIWRNAPNVTVWNEDVRRWLKNCKSRRLSSYPKPNQFQHIHLSPPCQGFSDANRNGGMNDNANNSLTLEAVEVIRFFSPPTFTLEQVPGVLKPSRGRRNVMMDTITELLLLDYQVRVCVVLASDYGDPQDRERVILFGAKRGYKLPEFPKTTHGPGLLPKVTAKDAIGILENVAPVPTSGLVEICSGGKIQVVSDHCLDAPPSEHKSNLGVLVPDKPAFTVRRTNAVQHYNSNRNRLITIREMALLQGFPIDYVFCGDHSSVRDQIGNAVPVNLARAIARSVLAAHNRS